MRLPMRVAVFCAVVSFTACAKQEILHDLDERDANEIVVLLSQATPAIMAQKLPDATSGSGGGNKGPKFMIAVPSADSMAAWKLLTDNQLPRRTDLGWKVFTDGGGLIPTASEEKAKMLQAITGELARTLKSVDGILDARVHVVMPEKSVLDVKEEDKAETTASVLYKYIPRGKNQQKPLTDQEIQDLVAMAVEKLKPERVKVIATPALGAQPSVAEVVAADSGTTGPMVSFVGFRLSGADAQRLRTYAIFAVLVFIVTVFGFTVALVRKSSASASPRGMARSNGEPPPG